MLHTSALVFTLSLDCKGGTKVSNNEYNLQHKKLAALKKEEPYRYLGVPMGNEVEQHKVTEICKQLIIDLEKVENSQPKIWGF